MVNHYIASGIGRAAAIAYAKSGVAGLFIVDLNLPALEEVAKECQAAATNTQFRSVAKIVDVTNEEDVIAMLADFVKQFGRLDYAANIAGVRRSMLDVQRSDINWQIGDIPTPTALHTVENFDRVHRVNVRGVFLCMREEIKTMLKQDLVVLCEGRAPTRGAIVNMGSIGMYPPVHPSFPINVSSGSQIGTP